MFEYMGDRISNALKNIRGMGKLLKIILEMQLEKLE